MPITPDDALFALLVRMTSDCLPEPEPFEDWSDEDDDWSDEDDDDQAEG